jgi:predicted O-methyltransferase YrrM
MSIGHSIRFSLLAPDTPLYAYLLAQEPPEHEALVDLRDLTSGMSNGFMQIGPDQGHLMSFIVKLIGARRILEIGTFTGYSALALALALPRDGHLITCDVDAEWASLGRKFWERAGVADKIEVRIGPAVDACMTLSAQGPTAPSI